MPKRHKLQTNFSAGEVDPKLFSRIDTSIFDNGAASLRNCKILPQGGATRRDPTRHLAILPNQVIPAADQNPHMIRFVAEDGTPFEIVLTDQLATIYNADGTVNASVAIPHTDDGDFDEITSLQKSDTLILFHKDYQPYKLLFQGGASWSSGVQNFENVPTFPFADSVSGGENEEQVVKLFSVSDGSKFRLKLENEWTDDIVRNAGSGPVTATRIQDALRALPNTSADGITVTHEGGAGWRVVFEGDDGLKDWPLMEGSTITDTDGTITVVPINDGKPHQDPIMSGARGWPRCGTIYQGRLYLGGFRSAQQALVAGVAGDFFNLDNRGDEDDQGFVRELDTDDPTILHRFFSGRHLLIFCRDAEFFVPEEPITPATAAVKRTTPHGIKPIIPPFEADGAVLFVQDTGSVVREFLFVDTEQSYKAPSISFRGNHLINAPVSATIQRGFADDEETLYLLVNGDGTMATLTTNRFLEITGWSPWDTDGKFRRVALHGDGSIWAIVERTIDGTATLCLEKFEESLRLDAAVTQVPGMALEIGDPISGLDHLEGEEVGLWLDGSFEGTAVVENGEILTPVPVENSIEVGRVFLVRGKTLPARTQSDDDLKSGRHKRVLTADLDMINTGSLAVGANGKALKPVPLRRLGDDLLDVPMDESLFSGPIKLSAFLGYSIDAQIEFGQIDPGPFTIRSLNYEVRT